MMRVFSNFSAICPAEAANRKNGRMNSAGAEALLRPLPTPDTAKLAPEVAKDVAKQRAEFDQVKPSLIGDDLAAAFAQIGAVYVRAGLLDAADVAFYDAAQLAPKDGRW